MDKLHFYLSESDFNICVLPHLTHNLHHNCLKVSHHYIFNMILHVLKSGYSWRTLKPNDNLVIWQNIVGVKFPLQFFL
jgi:hypothetical protein